MRQLMFVTCLLIGTVSQAAPQAAPPSAKQQVLWDQLRTTIDEVERRLDGVLGGAILDLTSGQELLVRPDEAFPQASSIKITVLAELYRQAEQSARGASGNVALTAQYVGRSQDVAAA